MKTNLSLFPDVLTSERLTAWQSATETDLTEHHVKTRYSNIWVDTRQEIWTPDGKMKVNVGAVRADVELSLHQGLDALLRHFVSKVAPGTLLGYVSAIRHYRKAMFGPDPISRWHIDDLTNYRSKLVNKYGNESNLIKLRLILKTWFALRIPGVEWEVVQTIESWRLKSYETGRAVRRMDPDSGPLLAQEYADLNAEVYRGAEIGAIHLADFGLYILHAHSGRRGDQTCSLKCLDIDPNLSASPDLSGVPFADVPIHRVSMPRSKQHGADWRSSFRDIILPRPEFNFLNAQRLSVQAKFREALSISGITLTESFIHKLLPSLPLFPNWKDIDESLEYAQELRQNCSDSDIPLRGGFALLMQHAQSRQWHLAASEVTTRLQNIAKVVDAKNRDAAPLNLTSTRLRFTKGTSLARLGASVEVIAWLLDHSNTQTVNVYTDNLPEHAAAINEALKGSWRMQLVARMFRGQVVHSEANAIGGDNPRASRIHFKGVSAATCGVNKACGLGVGIPIACYTCNNFQPWLDGPHEKVLSDLLQQRRGMAIVHGDPHPLTTRQDKTIVAVINVLQRCEEIRQHDQVTQSNGGIA